MPIRHSATPIVILPVYRIGLVSGKASLRARDNFGRMECRASQQQFDFIFVGAASAAMVLTWWRILGPANGPASSRATGWRRSRIEGKLAQTGV